jgi:hypothetical protein
MVSLVDIIPQRRTVELSVGSLELRGLGLRHIADLLLLHPELRGVYVAGSLSLDVDNLLAVAPSAVGSIIAWSANQPEAVDAIIDALTLDDLAECLIAIRDLTMPAGVDPFVERLARLLGKADALAGRAPGTSTPPLPSASSPADMSPAA